MTKLRVLCLLILATASSEVSAQCVRIQTSPSNVVAVVNRCPSPIVARLVEKRGEDLGTTGIVRPGARVRLSAAPSDFVAISAWCEVKGTRPCSPAAPATVPGPACTRCQLYDSLTRAIVTSAARDREARRERAWRTLDRDLGASTASRSGGPSDLTSQEFQALLRLALALAPTGREEHYTVWEFAAGFYDDARGARRSAYDRAVGSFDARRQRMIRGNLRGFSANQPGNG